MLIVRTCAWWLVYDSIPFSGKGKVYGNMLINHAYNWITRKTVQEY